MNTTTTTNTLKLRTHSIRTLTSSELSVAQGGCATSGCFCTRSGSGGGAGRA